ncbi:DUF3341 domain-containing protein [Blattabacterium cuenoti]|uniref:DUF3341 domain-containing protein n=1 Tax=Blattabacterium cuenoti TaxID=1653831 RepID=UPI00163D195E|nr:DUF3341 domain-containing protein [Blattabacterium cuenoti]
MNKIYTNIYVLYNNEKLLIQNAKIFKRKNYHIYDIYSPYPIHGIEKILDLKKSNLSFLSFIYGTIGFFIANILIWYTMIFDWPQNIGGKPSFSWIKNFPSFIPVIFELLIFFSAHFMCISYLIQCRLFPGRRPKNPDPRTTDDVFLIKMKIPFSKNYKTIKNSLKKNGAIEVNLIH